LNGNAGAKARFRSVGAAEAERMPPAGISLAVAIRDDVDFDEQLQRLTARLPRSVARVIQWSSRPGLHWVRVPAGVALMLGGVLSILPVLGLWMLPLGLVMLAKDVRFLRRPTARMLAWLDRRLPAPRS
jgi:hypothetical protein